MTFLIPLAATVLLLFFALLALDYSSSKGDWLTGAIGVAFIVGMAVTLFITFTVAEQEQSEQAQQPPANCPVGTTYTFPEGDATVTAPCPTPAPRPAPTNCPAGGTWSYTENGNTVTQACPGSAG